MKLMIIGVLLLAACSESPPQAPTRVTTYGGVAGAAPVVTTTNGQATGNTVYVPK